VKRALVALIAAIVLASCRTEPPTLPGAAAAAVVSPVDGIVVGVVSAGLGNVSSFELRAAGIPLTLEFMLGELENPTEFPPGHLAEHQASSSPVRVYFRLEGERRVAYRLEDAPEAGAS